MLEQIDLPIVNLALMEPSLQNVSSERYVRNCEQKDHQPRNSCVLHFVEVLGAIRGGYVEKAAKTDRNGKAVAQG